MAKLHCLYYQSINRTTAQFTNCATQFANRTVQSIYFEKLKSEFSITNPVSCSIDQHLLGSMPSVYFTKTGDLADLAAYFPLIRQVLLLLISSFTLQWATSLFGLVFRSVFSLFGLSES